MREIAFYADLAYPVFKIKVFQLLHVVNLHCARFFLQFHTVYIYLLIRHAIVVKKYTVEE